MKFYDIVKKIQNEWVALECDPQNEINCNPVGADPVSARKNKNGITLIALVITIIVMLILVGVTVTVALKGGLFDTAKRAASKTGEAATQERELLEYEYEIAKANGETDAETYDEYLLEKKYGVKIGDKVDYNEGSYSYTTDTSKGIGGSVGTQDSTTKKYPLNEATYTTKDLTWRVLGMDEQGRLELISENPPTDTVALANEEGYLYGTAELDKMCYDLYGKGTHAAEARNLKADDIDKLAGITEKDKETLNSNHPYGTKWTYRFPSSGSYLQYKKVSADGNTVITDWTNVSPLSGYADGTRDTQFKLPGSNDIISSSNRKTSEELTYTAYVYNIIGGTTGKVKRLHVIIWKCQTLSAKVRVLQELLSYSLAPTFKHLIKIVLLEFLEFMECFQAFGLDTSIGLYGSGGGSGTPPSCKFRPVVILESDISLSDSNSDGIWEINV